MFGYVPQPPFSGTCFWQLLRPVANLSALVRDVRRILPGSYLGVHLRAFGPGPECESNLNSFNRLQQRAKQLQPGLLPPRVCSMPPA